jgi:hypothetical protein
LPVRADFTLFLSSLALGIRLAKFSAQRDGGLARFSDVWVVPDLEVGVSRPEASDTR